MGFSKGGRGKQAPYTTTHVRVPDPLKAEVDNLIKSWRTLVDSGEMSPTEATVQVCKPEHLACIDFTEALAIAQKLMKQKKSANDSMIRLLEAIYGVELSKDVLRHPE